MRELFELRDSLFKMGFSVKFLDINNLYGPKKKKDSEKVGNLGQELADVLFTVCCIANNTEINLQNEWAKMMEQKHYGRDNQRFNRKS
ncbi:MAG: hypothetical protein NTV24_04890 [Candidatus Woesebacteria bacterium]|nr:hypothetical protein [Candidatus Woesebacteria bacterium]